MRRTIQIVAMTLAITAPVCGQFGEGGGFYFTGSGMVVFQQDSQLRDNTGGLIDALLAPLMTSDLELEFNTGFGVRAGVGYTFADIPLSLEFEYVYRSSDIDSISTPLGTLPAAGDTDSHSLMWNALLDIDFGDTGFGLYGGAGVGFTVSRAELTDVGGLPIGLLRDDDTTFSWQVLGGVKFAIDSQLVLYTGVRYFDAGDVNFDTLGGENQSLSVEFGFRVYF